MNTQELQKKFPEVYRDFFSQYTLVVSSPNSFFWTGEYSVTFGGGIAIVQNIPLRTYIGIEPLNKKAIEIGKIIFYDNSTKKFQKYVMPISLEEKIIDLLSNELNKINTNHNNIGFRFNVLNETRPGKGLASSAAFSSALATAFYILTKKISTQDITNWKKNNLSDLIQDNKQFNNTFRFSWKIESIFHNNASSGAGLICSLTNSINPIIYCIDHQKKEIIDKKTYLQFPFSTKLEETYKIIDNIKYYGSRINEFFDLIEIDKNKTYDFDHWPIDFGLIYSGDFKTTESTISVFRESTSRLYKDIIPFWKKNFQKHNIPTKNDLLHQFNTRTKTNLDHRVLTLSGISWEFLYEFYQLFKKGHSYTNKIKFCRAINLNHNLLRHIKVSTYLLNDICYLFNKKIRDLGGRSTGCKLTGGGIKGDVLFVFEAGSLRDKIDEVIQYLRENVNENISLDYANWLDGRDKEGVKIEQNLEEGIYSSFVSSGSLMIKSLDQESGIHSFTLTHEEFEKRKDEMDFLLNLPHNEIYIRGKKLTSKEIHSAKATIKILESLIKSVGKSINCDKLPQSSYTGDRNELQSKIITPLSRVIKEKTNKNLDLKITGGIIDYKVKLEPSNLKIYLIEKVF